MDILDQARTAIAQRVIAEEELARKKAQLLTLLSDPLYMLPIMIVGLAALSMVTGAIGNLLHPVRPKEKPGGE